MAYLEFFIFSDLLMVLRPREVVNLFPDLPKYYFGYKDVISFLSRLQKTKDSSELM